MIEFACTCGKVMKAPDALTGRRAKCRNCGAVLLIPSGPASGAPAAGAKAKAGASGRPDESARGAAAPPHSEAPATPQEELTAAYKVFERKTLSIVLVGCSLLLVLTAAAVLAGVFIHWAVGLVGGVVLFIGVAAPLAVLGQQHDKQAAAAVRDIEARHGLNKDQSLSLIWPLQSAIQSTGGQFKPFVAAVWGRDAYQKMLPQQGEAKAQKAAPPAGASPATSDAPTPKVLPHFACGYCHVPVTVDGVEAVCQKCKRRLRLWANVKCPRCGSGAELKEDLVGGTAGAIIGGLLLGGLGAAIGKAAAAKKTSSYSCLKCRRRWGMELFERADW